ncbi:MAG: TolC family protein [Bacteroidetes bacterium]|nr:TolC family protein [Bacteroidota bacterium]
MSRLIFLLFVFFTIPGISQEPLTINQFLNWVVSDHPAVKEGNQRVLQANNLFLMAKGNFDPKLNFAADRKKFDGKNYFTISENQLSIPSRWGPKFKAGYDFTSGNFLNPLDVRPLNGQAVLGLDIPLLQGLFFDEFRLILREAELNVRIQKIGLEQVKNDLLLEASKAYLSWLVAYQQKQVQNQALILAKNRLNDMVFSYLSGDKPVVDTTEVYVNVLTREASLFEVSLDYKLATQEIANYLWRNDQPVNPENYFPLTTSELEPSLNEDAETWVQKTMVGNPDLLILRLTGNQYQLERKWALEQFKPILNLQFNALATGGRFDQDLDIRSDNFLLENNYKLGLRAQIPILFRKERGKLQLMDHKIKEWEYKTMDKTQYWVTRTRQYYSAFETLKEQVNNLQNQSLQLNFLFEAEKIKFAAGESSVFLLNTREQKNLEINMKYIKTKGEWMKSYYALLWASGRIL